MKDEDLQKLLDIAESKKVSIDEVSMSTDVERYIKKYQITVGDTFIKNYIIYYHYWKSKQRDRMSRKSFFKRFARYFDKYMIGGDRGYYLDPEPFDLTIEGSFKARALLRKERSAKQQEKNKPK